MSEAVTEVTMPMHQPGARAKENSLEDTWLRSTIASGAAALPNELRARLAVIGTRIRVVKANIRMVNNVPAAMLFVWPVFVFWLVPAAFAAQKVYREPALQPLIALSQDLFRPNWAQPENGSFVDDIVALRDQRALIWGAIFGPAIVYGGIAFVALVLLKK